MLPSSIAGVPSIAGGIGITNLMLVSVTGRGSTFIGQSRLFVEDSLVISDCEEDS